MDCPLVYEINARCWLRELSEKARQQLTLESVPESEFREWQRLGFTHIWLMGVWETAAASVAFSRNDRSLCRKWSKLLPDLTAAEITGSTYAIGGYTVSPSLGGDAGLANFRRRLNDTGIKLLTDFVPNHTGLDHPWVAKFPGRFVQSARKHAGSFRVETAAGLRWIAHGKDPYFPPWTDTAQLDYRNPETRKSMIDQLLSVAQRCDGVRCDMSMLLLNDVFARTWTSFPSAHPQPQREFWDEAINAVKSISPDFLFLAEAYWDLEERLIDLGFDYVYDKTVYDLLIARRPSQLQQLLHSRSQSLLSHGAHFLENHDEPRIASLLAQNEHRAAALLILSLPGLRLLHEGQLSGAKIRASVHLNRRPPEPSEIQTCEMYENLVQALQKSSVGSGQCTVLQPTAAWPDNPTAQNFILLQWQSKPDEFDLVVVNLGPHRSQCRVHLTIPEFQTHNWLMADRLSPEKHSRSGAEMTAQGLFLDLHGHGAQIFYFSRAD